MKIHKANLLSLAMGMKMMKRATQLPEAMCVHVVHESDILLGSSIKVTLQKGAQLIHPTRCNEPEFAVILSGNARFELAAGYALHVAHSGIIVSGSGATFSIKESAETIEVNVSSNRVTVWACDRQYTVPAFYGATWHRASHQLIVKPRAVWP
jgi:hypothetical protein